MLETVRFCTLMVENVIPCNKVLFFSDLSNNLIEFIDSSSFPSLPQLETIILSYNRYNKLIFINALLL